MINSNKASWIKLNETEQGLTKTEIRKMKDQWQVTIKRIKTLVSDDKVEQNWMTLNKDTKNW